MERLVGDAIAVTGQGASVVSICGEKSSVILNRVVLFSHIKDSLVSVSSFCNSCHTGELMTKNCIIRKRNSLLALAAFLRNVFLQYTVSKR